MLKCKRMVNNKKAGLTLIEILVAFALMAVMIIPITGMFMMSARATAHSRELTTAGVIAQLRIEELVGMSKSELRDKKITDAGGTEVSYWSDLEPTNPDQPSITTGQLDDGGFEVTVTVNFAYKEEYPELAEVIAVVKNNSGRKLCEQANILNVGQVEESDTP